MRCYAFCTIEALVYDSKVVFSPRHHENFYNFFFPQLPAGFIRHIFRKMAQQYSRIALWNLHCFAFALLNYSEPSWDVPSNIQAQRSHNNFFCWCKTGIFHVHLFPSTSFCLNSTQPCNDISVNYVCKINLCSLFFKWQLLCYSHQSLYSLFWLWGT